MICFSMFSAILQEPELLAVLADPSHVRRFVYIY